MTQNPVDRGLCENPFDEDTWLVPPIINSGEFALDYVDKISGDGAKPTSAIIIRAEAEALVKYYLMELCGIFHDEIICDGTYPSWLKMKVYANKRISKFIEVGAISEERVGELSDSILGV